MILLEIDAGGIVAVEFEFDAPGTVDMNGVPSGIMASQGMEVEAREVHIVRLLGLFQTVEPDQNAFLQLGIDFGGFARRKKICQSFVSERLDHNGL